MLPSFTGALLWHAAARASATVQAEMSRTLVISVVRSGGEPSAFLRLVHLLQRVDDVRIGERRRVAKGTAFRDVTQESPHDLTRARLWEVGAEHDVVRTGDGADLLRHEIAQLVAERR